MCHIRREPGRHVSYWGQTDFVFYHPAVAMPQIGWQLRALGLSSVAKITGGAGREAAGRARLSRIDLTGWWAVCLSGQPATCGHAKLVQAGDKVVKSEISRPGLRRWALTSGHDSRSSRASRQANSRSGAVSSGFRVPRSIDWRERGLMRARSDASSARGHRPRGNVAAYVADRICCSSAPCHPVGSLWARGHCCFGFSMTQQSSLKEMTAE